MTRITRTSLDDWFAQATPEQADAYRAGQKASQAVIQQQARKILAYTAILEKIARGDIYDPAFAARHILNAHKATSDTAE